MTPPEALNKLKVTVISAEDVRLAEPGGRAPDVLVKTRLLSRKQSTSLSRFRCEIHIL